MFDETVLDAGILAAQGRLLISEDLHYRGIVEAAVGAHGVWLQAVFMFARKAGQIDQLRYAGFVSQLAARRHGHVAITAAFPTRKPKGAKTRRRNKRRR